MRLVVLVLLISFSSFAQNKTEIDSLDNLLSTVDGKEKIELYKKLAWDHRDSSPLQAQEFANLALEIALQMGEEEEVASIYNYLGVIKRNQFDYPEALNYFYKALNFSLEIDSKIEIGYASNNIGDIHNRRNDDSLAFSYFKKASETFIAIKDDKGLAYCFNQISMLFEKSEIFDSALIYNYKALEIKENINNQEGIANSYRNIGNIHLEKEEFELAHQFFIKALEIDSLLNNTPALIKDYCSLGKLMNRKGLFNEAIKYLELSKGIDNKETELTLKDTYKELSFAYKEMNDFKKAFENHIIYKALDDSISDEEKLKEQIQLSMQFEFDKKQEQEKIIEKANKRRQTIIWYTLLGVILLILIILITVFKAYQLIQKTNKKLLAKNKIIIEQKNKLEEANIQLLKDEKIIKESNDTKDKFISIIAHDLKSPFTSILGYTDELHQSYENYNDERRKEFIKYLNIAAENTYNLLQNLLDWARSHSNNLEIKPVKQDINELILENIDLLQIESKEKAISVIFEPITDAIVTIDVQMINTVIRNLLSNAIKFTYPRGEIKISTSLKDEEIYVSFEDNGVGMKEEDLKKLFKIDQHLKSKGTANETGTGLGLLLTKEFVDKNGGEIFVVSQEGKGSTFSFSLPLTKT